MFFKFVQGEKWIWYALSLAGKNWRFNVPLHLGSTLELLKVFGFRTVRVLLSPQCFIIDIHAVRVSFFSWKHFSLIISKSFIKLFCKKKKIATILGCSQTKVRSHLKACVTWQGREPSREGGLLVPFPGTSAAAGMCCWNLRHWQRTAAHGEQGSALLGK